ncbi:peptidoglycan editing factor PgeF [Dyella subtropica]|uniref:peptidoglycan editing factor PgeF n=1 Tax=Dyella subtropica TaxID=2992127 RepID=UPI002259B7C8|nr:peptidoglycan editing factor PgeF [Dyella subtropica]
MTGAEVVATLEGWLLPAWSAPPGVRAAVSTRQGPGVSQPPYERFNLGSRCGDTPEVVAANRETVRSALQLPRAPHWLRQVHGVDVAECDPSSLSDPEPNADASVTRSIGEPLAILTADCMPVLFCAIDGSEVAAAHAGWRGLAAGVLEATVAHMQAEPADVMAWLGPCIGAASYEVGEEVRSTFVNGDSGAASCFAPTRPGHWLCDLAGLARRRLAQAGVLQVYGGGFDTLTDPRFYSYRRDGAQSGRFATLIWLE